MSNLTTADLAALDQAIASGYLKVRYEDKEVTYQSIDQMLKARAFAAAQLDQSRVSTIKVDHVTFGRDYE
jgi:hypothetical protein